MHYAPVESTAAFFCYVASIRGSNDNCGALIASNYYKNLSVCFKLLARQANLEFY